MLFVYGAGEGLAHYKAPAGAAGYPVLSTRKFARRGEWRVGLVRRRGAMYYLKKLALEERSAARAQYPAAARHGLAGDT
ncbi:hypothetical protein [Janthinobacterium fluminis]|uniref:Uncharacterized protein n=1 Tax=Janthinobacterium fluminis TaxID=2987524 RepID=A0ABT5K5D6_9BURK|nr:hypothetical protein [Janthinobacterium fluminis]MDC8758967.1 hypothetical protein [Janthinobacterium fluminis]